MNSFKIELSDLDKISGSNIIFQIGDFGRLLENSGVKADIVFKVNSGYLDIVYDEISDDGKFVNFCGFMVNTKSLKAVLGYNCNNERYIPIFDVVDLLNGSIFGQGSSVIGKDEALYIIESFKLDFGGFDLYSYLEEVLVLKGVDPSSISFNSVILNYLKRRVGISGVDEDGIALFKSMNNGDLFKMLGIIVSGVLGGLDIIGRSFFMNFIAEDDMSEVERSYKEGIISGSKRHFLDEKKNFESIYLRLIADFGLPPNLVVDISSLGFGRNRRMDVVKDLAKSGADNRKALAVLSSFSYVDDFESKSVNYKAISDEKILTYNIMDLLRGIGKDQDLLFSYDFMNDVKNDTLYRGLIKRLQIDVEVGRLGDRFIPNVLNYARNMMMLMDKGSLYSKKVKDKQNRFLSFSSKEIMHSGKITEKMLGRIMKKL